PVVIDHPLEPGRACRAGARRSVTPAAGRAARSPSVRWNRRDRAAECALEDFAESRVERASGSLSKLVDGRLGAVPPGAYRRYLLYAFDDDHAPGGRLPVVIDPRLQPWNLARQCYQGAPAR